MENAIRIHHVNMYKVIASIFIVTRTQQHYRCADINDIKATTIYTHMCTMEWFGKGKNRYLGEGGGGGGGGAQSPQIVERLERILKSGLTKCCKGLGGGDVFTKVTF